MQARGCPLGKFGPSENGGTMPQEKVLNERRVVCGGCPIGGLGGGGGPNVAMCREICRPCNTLGLIDITIHRCPRGHHEG